MNRLVFTAVALAWCFTCISKVHAETTVEMVDDRLVVTCDEVGEEEFEFEGYGGGVVVVYVDGEFLYYFTDVRKIICNGDDDRDIFINNSEVPSIMNGHGGDDILIGGFNGDRLYGGEGVDYLDGRARNDFLDPGPDLDDGVVLGGTGDDILIRNRYKYNSPFQRYTLKQEFRNLDLGGDPMDEIRNRSAVITSYGAVFYLEN